MSFIDITDVKVNLSLKYLTARTIIKLLLKKLKGGFMKVDEARAQLSRIVELFLFVAELGLAVRFVLHFFAVDPSNGFAAWVFNSTDALVTPFRNVFTTAPVGHPHYVDISLLFIAASYVVAAAVLTKIFTWSTTSKKK